jgi:DEP domain-containing protein 5
LGLNLVLGDAIRFAYPRRQVNLRLAPRQGRPTKPLSFRFVGRAKMHQIQMLGLLDFDVASSIEIPYLPTPADHSLAPLEDARDDAPISRAEADTFDMDIFLPKGGSQVPTLNRTSVASLGSVTIRNSERRNSHRNSVITTKIHPIEESPRRVIVDLPVEDSPSTVVTPTFSGLSTSPSQSSIHSLRSTMSTTSPRGPRDSFTRGTLAKLTPSWLLSPFRSGSSEPQTSQTSASSTPSTPSTPTPTRATALPQSSALASTSVRIPTPSKHSAATQVSRSPLPMAIKGPAPLANRSSVNRIFEEDGLISQRASYVRHSPMNSPPREEANFGKRRSTTSIYTIQYSSPSPGIVCNPSQPRSSVPYSHSSLARRWQHMFPQVLYKHEIKWKAMVVPVCLALTVEQFPSASELETFYDVFSYDFVVDPHEMCSFLVRPPTDIDNLDDLRRAWARVVMRGMAAVRLAQGFQFVLRPPQKTGNEEAKWGLRRTKSFLKDEDLTPKPIGAADVLHSTTETVYLSMTNEIHQISYTGEAIQVRRYVRRMSPLRSFEYRCLMWPKLGGKSFCSWI